MVVLVNPITWHENNSLAFVGLGKETINTSFMAWQHEAHQQPTTWTKQQTLASFPSVWKPKWPQTFLSDTLHDLVMYTPTIGSYSQIKSNSVWKYCCSDIYEPLKWCAWIPLNLLPFTWYKSCRRYWGQDITRSCQFKAMWMAQKKKGGDLPKKLFVEFVWNKEAICFAVGAVKIQEYKFSREKKWNILLISRQAMYQM